MKNRFKYLYQSTLALVLASVLIFSGGCISITSDRQETEEKRRPTETTEEAVPETDPTVIEETEDLNEEIEEAIILLQTIDWEILDSHLSDDYLSTYFRMSDPEAVGIPYPDPVQPKRSYEDFMTTIEDTQDRLDRLQDIDVTILPREYQIMYDVLIYDLEETLEYEDYYYYGSPFNSITGTQSNLPLSLSQMEFESVDDAENYILLLVDTYAYFDNLIEFEKERAAMGLGKQDVHLELLIESCLSMLEDQDTHFLIDSFIERLSNIETISDDDAQRLIQEHQEALEEYLFPAYEMMAEEFENLMGQGVNELGLVGFDQGQAYYEVYLKSRTGLDITPEEAIMLLDNAIDDKYDFLFSLSFDQDDIDNYLERDFSMGSVEEDLAFCLDIISSDFPELPEHNLITRSVPEAVEEFFSPAAYFRCRLDDPTNNIIVINDAKMGDSQELLDTVAHEGYPGHLYQNVYHATHIDNYIQRLGSFTPFSEGWAEYAGEYAVRHAGFDPVVVDLYYFDLQVTKLMMARADIGIHYEGWTKDDLRDYLREFGMATDEAVDYFWDLIIEIPCYITPYTFGQYYTDYLIDNALEQTSDDVTLYDVHEAYLSIGPAPLQILEKYMEEFVNNV